MHMRVQEMTQQTHAHPHIQNVKGTGVRTQTTQNCQNTQAFVTSCKLMGAYNCKYTRDTHIKTVGTSRIQRTQSHIYTQINIPPQNKIHTRTQEEVTWEKIPFWQIDKRHRQIRNFLDFIERSGLQ